MAAKIALTPSGRAEAVFANMNLEQALNSVQSTCMDAGWMVTSQTSNQVVCEVPMSVWQSALAQMAIGNSYSTTPKMYARFSLAQIREHTRAQAQVWAETQMPFGQLRQEQFVDDNTFNNMLGFFAKAGAQLPVGTTFPSSAYLGVEIEPGTRLQDKRAIFAVHINAIVEESPGAKMGLLVDDMIIEVNGQKLKDIEGFSKALAKQKLGRPMSLTIVRDGVEKALSGIAEQRPPIDVLRPVRAPATGPSALAPAANTASSQPALEAAVSDGGTELERAKLELLEAQERVAKLAGQQAVTKDSAE
jgi:hypothetical protein